MTQVGERAYARSIRHAATAEVVAQVHGSTPKANKRTHGRSEASDKEVCESEDKQTVTERVTKGSEEHETRR